MFIRLNVIVLLSLLCLLIFAKTAFAQSKLQIELTIPQINTNPYHRPFVAVWLEKENRQYVTTLALWANDMEWYKDLRQWWRKAGRSNQPFDGVTGATKKPGKYQINWSGKDAYGKTVNAGHYLLKIEAAREEGGREFIKSKVTIDENGKMTISGTSELAQVFIQSYK